ncbi:MAG: 50S ribosomal protein L34e [Candidatus Micrarchaeota archaeon]
MPLPKNRSKKYKKIARKTSHGTKVVFIKRKVKLRVSCAICKKQLTGIKFGSKTEKSVSRKFGGCLCHACSVRIIKDASRIAEGIKSIDNVDLIYKNYVERLLKKE